MSGITTLIMIGLTMLCTLCGVTLLTHIYNLNHIKSKTVGNGQHGTARWANKWEIKKTYRHIPYTLEKWRKQARFGEIPTMSLTKKKIFQKTKRTEEVLPQGIRGV